MNPSILRGLVLALALGSTGCDDDPARPDVGATREYAVVVNSVSVSLTVFPTGAPDSTFTIGLEPQGTPVAVAVRGETAIVPLGAFPAVAVVDLRQRAVVRTIPVGAGTGPTGVAIVDDSLAFVTLSTADAVVPILYDRGTVLDPIATGTWPEAVVFAGGRVYVLDTRFQLGTFDYEGPGTVTVIDPTSLATLGAIELTGLNPGAAVAMGGSLWVLNRGNYFDVDGSLSEVDPSGLTEVDHLEGFGSGPGDLAVFDGRLAIAAFSYGVALWAPGTGFSIAPDDGFRPDPMAAVASVGVDESGRLHIVDAQCSEPGGVWIVDDGMEVIDHADAEVCPFDVVFTEY